MSHSSKQVSPFFAPMDAANKALKANVAPDNWENPIPTGRYNLVVIGGGSAGLVTAAGAAGLGARVALIEKSALGGDCLNVGCVPSKALLAAAKRAAAMRDAAGFGLSTEGGCKVDFPSVMKRMRSLRAGIAPHDSAARFCDLGVDVFFGAAVFRDSETIEVGGQILGFSKAVIATGARASGLSIPGLDEAGALTNETLFSLTELPKRLAVVGGGPIGCEMAQAFARLGSEVILFGTGTRVLPKEDAEAAKVVQVALQNDGVRLIFGAELERVERGDSGKQIHFKQEGAPQVQPFDHVLIATGRTPNVAGLGLAAAGVAYDPQKGVKVDATLRTSNPKIFAIGDVAMAHKFTHMAGATARLVIQNALFKGRKQYTKLLVPWCTYTQPELAHVGLGEAEANERYGTAVQTFTQKFADVDRSVLEGKTEGFVRVHVVKGRIVGATIVGEYAGELISEISVVMQSGMKLSALSGVIHPYPTCAEAIQRLGDAYNRTRFTPLLQRLFRLWLKLTR